MKGGDGDDDCRVSYRGAFFALKRMFMFLNVTLYPSLVLRRRVRYKTSASANASANVTLAVRSIHIT